MYIQPEIAGCKSMQCATPDPNTDDKWGDKQKSRLGVQKQLKLVQQCSAGYTYSAGRKIWIAGSVRAAAAAAASFLLF